MPEPKTLGEALDRLAEIQDKEAVYNALVEHLTPLISTDSHKPEKGIMSPRLANVPIDEGIIIGVQNELKKVLRDLDKEAKQLRSLGVGRRIIKKAPKRRSK
jgi:hypothetical protein